MSEFEASLGYLDPILNKSGMSACTEKNQVTACKSQHSRVSRRSLNDDRARALLGVRGTEIPPQHSLFIAYYGLEEAEGVLTSLLSDRCLTV